MNFEKEGTCKISETTTEKGRNPDSNIQKSYDYAFGVIRLKKKIDYILNRNIDNHQLENLPSPIRNSLRIGAYGILETEDPEYAVVNECVNLSKKYGHRGTASLVNGVLRNLNNVELPVNRTEYLSINYSFPEFLVNKFLHIYGDKTENILKNSNKIPPASIRVNRTRISTRDLKNKLSEEGIECTINSNLNYNLLAEKNPLFVDSFRQGLFQIQGERQIKNTELLKPQKGEIILDLCASPGTKSTLIAEITESKSAIISVDLKNLKNILENARRLGLKNIHPVKASATNFNIKGADRIMLDVPCSGTGVLAKRAEIRWKLNKKSLDRLKKLQCSMLNNAAKNLKKGGTLVYSTCSILPEENEERIERFLAENEDFTIVPVNDKNKYSRNVPGDKFNDGGFGAVLRRR